MQKTITRKSIIKWLLKDLKEKNIWKNKVTAIKSKAKNIKLLKPDINYKKAKQLGLKKVLLTTGRNNIASAKIMIYNNAKLHSEELIDGKITQRYYIKMS